jgi:hypothetical protein
MVTIEEPKTELSETGSCYEQVRIFKRLPAVCLPATIKTTIIQSGCVLR